MFSTTSGSRDPILEKIGQRLRSHGQIMYKIRLALKRIEVTIFQYGRKIQNGVHFVVYKLIRY